MSEKAHAEVHRIVFDLILLAFFAVFGYLALGLRSDSRLVPLIVAIPALAAMAIQTALDVRRAVRSKAAAQRERRTEPVRDGAALASASLADLARVAMDEVAAEQELPDTGAQLRRQRVFALWGAATVLAAVLGTAYLPPVLGLRTYFLPAAAVALLVILRFVGLGWPRVVITAAAVITFMDIVLGELLGVRF